jgi:hypothetical protein
VDGQFGTHSRSDSGTYSPDKPASQPITARTLNERLNQNGIRSDPFA